MTHCHPDVRTKLTSGRATEVLDPLRSQNPYLTNACLQKGVTDDIVTQAASPLTSLLTRTSSPLFTNVKHGFQIAAINSWPDPEMIDWREIAMATSKWSLVMSSSQEVTYTPNNGRCQNCQASDERNEERHRHSRGSQSR